MMRGAIALEAKDRRGFGRGFVWMQLRNAPDTSLAYPLAMKGVAHALQSRRNGRNAPQKYGLQGSRMESPVRYYVRQYERRVGTHEVFVPVFNGLAHSHIEQPDERPRAIDIPVENLGGVEAQGT